MIRIPRIWIHNTVCQNAAKHLMYNKKCNIQISPLIYDPARLLSTCLLHSLKKPCARQFSSRKQRRLFALTSFSILLLWFSPSPAPCLPLHCYRSVVDCGVGCPNFALKKFSFEAKLSETETISLQFRETTQKSFASFRFVSFALFR